METRKIQRVSNGTYTVSLPREWATDQGLSAGDVVHLHAHLDGALTIQPAADELGRLSVRVTDETRAEVAHLLRAAYAVGALDIDLVASDGLSDEQRAAVRSTVRALSGVTIAGESDTGVAVRNVLDSEQVSIRQSVRHLRFVALSHHREATAALCDPAVDAGPAAADGRAERLSGVVERYFARSLSRLDEIDRLGESRASLFCLYRLADELARVAACAGRIAAVAAEVDDDPADDTASAPAENDASDAEFDSDVVAEFQALAEDAREATETAVDAVFDPDPDAVWSVFDAREALVASVDDLERRLFEAPNGDYRIARALPSIRATAERAAAIAGIGLRRGLRDGSLDSARVGDVASGAIDEPQLPTETDD